MIWELGGDLVSLSSLLPLAVAMQARYGGSDSGDRIVAVVWLSRPLGSGGIVWGELQLATTALG